MQLVLVFGLCLLAVAALARPPDNKHSDRRNDLRKIGKVKLQSADHMYFNDKWAAHFFELQTWRSFFPIFKGSKQFKHSAYKEN